MRLITSWYKNELLKQNFRQVGWIGLIYFIILFFSLPLNIFMTFSQGKENYYHTSSVFDFGVAFQFLTIFIIPVLMAMFILRYLHQKDASDFLHSLPIKREHLFWQQAGFGMITLWLPIVINGFLVYLLTFFLDLGREFTLTDLAYWFIFSLVIVTFIYSLSLVIGTLTGITIVQGIFTYIFLFLPVGFSLLFYTNLNFAVIGLPVSRFISDQLFQFSPITDLANIMYSLDESHMKMWIYFILTIIALFIAQLLYKSRPGESATQPIAFQKLKPVFIYSFTFCFTLIGGLYFAVFNSNFVGILIGYLIFSLIGYFIAQMIVHKTWRVIKEWREYTYFFIGFVLLTVFLTLDVTGYQNRIPEPDEIESVFVIDDMYSYQRNIDRYDDLTGFTTQEDINKIREYHQFLIDDSSHRDSIINSHHEISILYRLKNGKEVVREYHHPYNSFKHKKINWVYDTPTYLQYTRDVFLIDSFDIKELRFYSWAKDNDVVVTNRDQITELMMLLKQDLLDVSPDHLFEAHLDIILRNSESTGVSINRKDERVVEWLMNNDLVDQAIVGADDIESVTISEGADYAEIEHHQNEARTEYGDQDLKTWEITDRDQIERLFDLAYYDGKDGKYLLTFHLKNSRDGSSIAIDKADLPADILEQIN